MKKLLKISGSLYLLITFLLLFCAPKLYSREYCALQMLLFLIFSGPLLYKQTTRLGFFNFYTLFLFSFFCINYLHAVFLYPNDSFLVSFSFPYNIHNICKGISMASFCMSSFIFGSSFDFASPILKKNAQRKRLISKTAKIALLLSIGVLGYVLLFVNVGFKHLYPRLMLLITCVISLSFFYKVYYGGSKQGKTAIFNHIVSYKFQYLSAIFFSIALLRIGSRTNIVILWITIFAIINKYIYRLKIKQIAPLMFIGVCFMGIITLTRISPVNLSNSDILTVIQSGYSNLKNSPDALWLIMTDFLVNSRTLYDCIDFVNVNGILYGETYLQYTLSFLPGGGRFITMLYLQKEPIWTNTDNYLIEFTHAPYGMGTNMVADIYMNCGMVGLFFLPMIFSLIVKYSSHNTNKYRNFLYLSLIGNSVYIPRASIFCFLDMFFILIICDYFLNLIFNKKNRTYGDQESPSETIVLPS